MVINGQSIRKHSDNAEAVKAGEIDIHMEMWTDNLPTYQSDLSAGHLKVSLNFDDNAQGLSAALCYRGDPERGIEPIAPDLKTVADLKNYASLLGIPEELQRELSTAELQAGR